MLFVVAFAPAVALPRAHAAEIDRPGVDFRTPDEIRWARNPAGPAAAIPAEKR